MIRKLYVAYGSNMSVEQMKYRCPNAVLLGTGFLKGWRLAFRYHATIIESKDESVPVLVWDISKADENRLDRYEGYPSYYLKKDVCLSYTGLDGEKHQKKNAMVYIMHLNYRNEEVPPSSAYFEVISNAYDQFGFDKSILSRAYDEVAENANGMRK